MLSFSNCNSEMFIGKSYSLVKGFQSLWMKICLGEKLVLPFSYGLLKSCAPKTARISRGKVWLREPFLSMQWAARKLKNNDCCQFKSKIFFLPVMTNVLEISVPPQKNSGGFLKYISATSHGKVPRAKSWPWKINPVCFVETPQVSAFRLARFDVKQKDLSTIIHKIIPHKRCFANIFSTLKINSSKMCLCDNHFFFYK